MSRDNRDFEMPYWLKKNKNKIRFSPAMQGLCHLGAQGLGENNYIHTNPFLPLLVCNSAGYLVPEFLDLTLFPHSEEESPMLTGIAFTRVAENIHVSCYVHLLVWTASIRRPAIPFGRATVYASVIHYPVVSVLTVFINYTTTVITFSAIHELRLITMPYLRFTFQLCPLQLINSIVIPLNRRNMTISEHSC